MSSISHLLAEQCPNGVEWHNLGDVCLVKTGPNINKQMIADRPGPYPVINSGRAPLGYVDHYNTEDDPIGIASRGSVGLVTWTPGRFFRGNLNYSCTVRRRDQLHARFLYHFLLESDSKIQALATHEGIPALNAGALKTLQVPVPPMMIQLEMVRVLDSFTELMAELSAELAARKEQYRHYRNSLLHLAGKEVDWRPLSEVVEFKRGRQLKMTELRAGPYPVVTAGKTESSSHSSWNFAAGSVTITSHGAYAGHVNYWPTPIWLANNVYLLSPKSILSPKFLYYFLKANEHSIQGLAKGGGVPYFNVGDVAPFLIPIPHPNDAEQSLALQSQIAGLLDSFDTLTNSKTEGLPREMALRQKQYAHYRAKLLSLLQPENMAA